MDYGSNVTVGKGAFVNYNCVFADTCSISIGARTLVGPGVSFLSATHPLDPLLRNGTKGPELGKPIVVEEDCWIAANVTLLPGVTIGRGATVGAGSVVTKVSSCHYRDQRTMECDWLICAIGCTSVSCCGGKSGESHQED